MTTIITRLYADATTARNVASALMARGLDQDLMDVVGLDGAGTLEERMHAAEVPAATAGAYAAAMTKGKTLVVVRAPFAPMGAARNAIRTMDRTPSVKVGVVEETYVRIEPDVNVRASIMPDHPFFMSNPHRPMSHGHVFGAKLLSAHKEKRSVYPGGKLMSGMFWPMKHLSKHREKRSVIHGTWLFSRVLGDMPTVTRN